MHTITCRNTKAGVSRYTCQIRVRTKTGDTSVSQTFSSQAKARAWGRKRSAEFQDSGQLRPITADAVTFGESIRKYIETTQEQCGRTKLQCLNAILADEIADLQCEAVTSQQLFVLATRLAKGRAAATVANYMSHLGPIFT